MFDNKDYTLEKKLNEGSMSTVWSAFSNKTKKPVVIKISKKSNQQNAYNEAAILSKLENSNIVKLEDYFVIHDLICLVLEKADFDLMDFIVTKTRLTEDVAKRIFRQICRAVQYCHKNQVAHLDLKPENIFLDSNLNVHLGDFELSYNWRLTGDETTTSRVGTVYYAAPEINSISKAQRQEPFVGWRADIWSLGILLYVMVSGTWPFMGATYEIVEQEARLGNVRYPYTRVSEPLMDLLQQMLQVDPMSRPSMEQVLDHPWLNDFRRLSMEGPSGKPVFHLQLDRCRLEGLSPRCTPRSPLSPLSPLSPSSQIYGF